MPYRLLLVLLALLSPPTRALGEETLLSAFRAEHCVIMMLAEAESKTLRVRTSRADGKLCQVGFAQLARLLDDGMATAARQSTSEWTSFLLGRAVEYPWLSRGLAEAALFDERWDSERGTSTRGHPNALVAELLAQPGLARRLYPVFARHGYRVTAVGVEKVLGTQYHSFIGEHAETGERCMVEAVVPFDAQVWLRLNARDQANPLP